MTLLTKIKWGLAALVAVALTVLVIYANDIRNERDRLALDAARFREAAAALQDAVHVQQVALVAREAERARLIDEKIVLESKLEDLYERDPKARAWADAAYPDDIFECLRETAVSPYAAHDPAGGIPTGCRGTAP